jgi:hypothetical protein
MHQPPKWGSTGEAWSQHWCSEIWAQNSRETHSSDPRGKQGVVLCLHEWQAEWAVGAEEALLRKWPQDRCTWCNYSERKWVMLKRRWGHSVLWERTERGWWLSVVLMWKGSQLWDVYLNTKDTVQDRRYGLNKCPPRPMCGGAVGRCGTLRRGDLMGGP